MWRFLGSGKFRRYSKEPGRVASHSPTFVHRANDKDAPLGIENWWNNGMGE
jgi:hypothetical protein